MKITSRKLRTIIKEEIQKMAEGEVIDFNAEKGKRRKTPRQSDFYYDDEKEQENISSIVSGDSKEDWTHDVEDEIEAMMQGIESGEVVDLADSDPFDYDYMTEQKDDDGNTAYPGQLGIGVDTGDSAKTKQQIEDEITNTTSQLNKLGSSTSDQQQRKVLNDQLQDLQHELSNS